MFGNILGILGIMCFATVPFALIMMYIDHKRQAKNSKNV